VTPGVERRALLAVARQAIVVHVTGVSAPPQPSSRGASDQLAGAFVSLHIRGDLRGCIGHIEADRPIRETIEECARSACSADPRFPPVDRRELDDLEIELSILGALERVGVIEDVEVGRHGLLIEHTWRRGLLLPQVATEHGWNRRVFVEQTCHKAGLPPDGWQRGATLWRFEAEVFGEGPRPRPR
jgi:AmmeMemoRadiSam system protein A